MDASTIAHSRCPLRLRRRNDFRMRFRESRFNRISIIRTRVGGHRLIVGSGRFTHVANDHISYSIAYQRVSSNRRNYNGPNVDPQFASFVPFGDFEFLNVNRGKHRHR